jgi:hypothetical protein
MVVFAGIVFPAVQSLPAISSIIPPLQRNPGIGEVAHRIPENGVDNAERKSLDRYSSLLYGRASLTIRLTVCTPARDRLGLQPIPPVTSSSENGMAPLSLAVEPPSIGERLGRVRRIEELSVVGCQRCASRSIWPNIIAHVKFRPIRARFPLIERTRPSKSSSGFLFLHWFGRIIRHALKRP